MQEFTEQERKNYINNTLPITCENIAIKPSAWEKMSEPEKEEFQALFWGLSELAELSGEYIDRTSAPMYDMFILIESWARQSIMDTALLFYGFSLVALRSRTLF